MTRATVEQKRHFNKVSQLGCVACSIDGIWTPFCEIHHIREGNGMGQRDHDRIIPLCYHHHRAVNSTVPSIHGNKKDFEFLYGTESYLLDLVKNMLDRSNKG